MKKPIKRLFSVLLVLALLSTILPRFALPVRAVTYSGECGDNLTWTFTQSSQTLTITGSGSMTNYASSSDCPWYAHRKYIAAVSLPEGLSSIGDNAFYGCSSLSSVTIPDSVTEIGSCAFESCSALASVSIPDSVTEIGSAAFEHCSSLTSVTIPDAVTVINDVTFLGCSSLVSVIIPDSVTRFGFGVFWDCSALRAFAFPDGVSYIDDFMFWGCSSLTAVTIPDSVTEIGDKAFCGCSSLSSVTIPDSVTLIRKEAFLGCTSLRSVTISDSVRSIAIYTFAGCSSLRSVTIPDSVTIIDYGAFRDCTSLRALTVCNPNCEIFSSMNDVNTFGNPARTVLYGYLNSTTQQYAEKWGYTFCPLDGFSDVNPAAWYAVPVAWAVENGITAGTGESSFSPNKTCTREQAATFLWRANGSPEPDGTENPFADVKAGKYYCDAVLWAYHHEPRIAGGVSETSFGVGRACNRAQVVTFLWNAAGKPEPAGTSNPFSDVSDADYYYKPVLWAVENGVTGGTTPTTFSPTQSCTRAQVVTFLYKVCGS